MSDLTKIDRLGIAGALPALLPALIAMLPVLCTTSAHAQDGDRFRLTAGGYGIYRYDSTLSLTQTQAGLGISFSPEDTLGWDSEQTVFRLDGRYRFSDKHAMTFSWYQITSDGVRTLEKDIEWVDQDGNQVIIPIGAEVTSTFDYDIFKLGYLWSFYHNDKVELSAGAGLHMTRVAVNLAAETTSSGIGAEEADTSVPLPVVTFALRYNATARLDWYLQTELFAISLGDWDGNYADIQLGIEYRAFDNIGFGLGLGTNALKLTEESANTRFDFENRISGVHMFVSGYF